MRKLGITTGSSPVVPGPFLPDFVVVEHSHEDAADHRSRRKAHLPATIGLIPIGHRLTVGRLAQEANHGCDQSLEVVLVVGERRCPQRPVELGVRLAVVERQAVAIQRSAIEIHFFAAHAVGEEIQAEHAVPHQIVFLTPGARFVEGQPEVVAVRGFGNPPRREFLRRGAIFLGRLLVAPQLAELGKRAESANRFGREVDVVCQMSGEVVGAELVLGIETFLLEIGRPLLELRPVALCEIGVSIDPGDRGHQDQQIAALLDGHLIPSAGLSAAVDLPVGLGIGAQIVRREGELPAIAGGIVHKRHDERLGQRGAEQQELRGHGIEHVRRRDAAVGMVFLAELQRLPIGVGHEFPGGETLPVSQGCERRVLGAARRREITRQLVVKLRAAIDQRLVVSRGFDEQSRGVESVSTPVGSQTVMHVLDRVQVVVSDNQPGRDSFGPDLG